MSEIVRIIRVLEYTGPREELEKCLVQNAVKGQVKFGRITIREAIVGNFPEVLGEEWWP
jgi:hypothetical protein